MNGYRIDWTRFVPGENHTRESDFLRGDLDSVREFLDSQSVYGRDPIIVTEFISSDGDGRLVPSEEWDI